MEGGGSSGSGKGTRPESGHVRGRKARRTRRNPPGSPAQRLEKAILAAIRTCYQEIFGRPSADIHPIPFSLRVRVAPGDPWRLTADPSIEEQIRAAVLEMATKAEAYRPGRVYCYRCESPICSHGQPPRPTSVFAGYSPTGLPVWQELTQVLLERRHPRIDLLYDPAQRDLVALYMEPNVLKQRQLNVFGRDSKTYDILGQVVFGFLRLRSPAVRGNKPERVAFTLQAVESRRINGTRRLELNVLARLSDGSPALDAIAGPHHMQVFNLISSARHRLHDLLPAPARAEKRSRGIDSPLDPTTRTSTLLKGLANRLERIGRRKGRTTLHAQVRRTGNRPTSKAWEDALAAKDDLILWDKRERTFVVQGPRNRIHVFTPEGRHVTSLVLSPEAVRSRCRRKRWIPSTPAQRAAFDSAIRRATNPEGGSRA